MGALSALKPERVFYYFEEISKIPHGSYNTKALSDYCVQFAKDHNLEYYQDTVNNVIIYKKATPGYEQISPVILQGHLDMVCEKEADSTIDFSKDGLELMVSGDDLYANKTTLGGDDGVAVALCLAILEDEENPHPALEILFTTEEEVGLIGAAALDASKLSGKYFINLDSEEENTLTCGCAGGVRIDGSFPLEREFISGMRYKIELSSFQGGHSGMEIDKWHINPVILMGRLLSELAEHSSVRLLSLEGGNKDNAIPREAMAEILIPISEGNKLEQMFARLKEEFLSEFLSMEPEMKMFLTAIGEGDGDALFDKDFSNILFFLLESPAGVQAMSADIPGLVETSLNLGVFELQKENLKVSYALRSSKNTARIALEKKIKRYIMHFPGGSASTRGEYPAWEYRKHSPLRDLCTAVYKERYQKDMKVEAIHAGLECGIFSEKLKDLDCVSLGADVFDVHTPKERLSISSTKRTYEYLWEILKKAKDCL